MAGSPSLEIVGAERLDDLAALQPIAELVFGRGRRRPDWFRRKLAREGVEAELSALALERGRIIGYALLGRAPSLGALARGAGVGVVEDARGRGVGQALIACVSERAGAAGCEAIEFLAEPARADWYLRQGFEAVEEQLTLIADGLGTRDEIVCDSAAADYGAEPEWAWIPEIWTRSPVRERARVELALAGGAAACAWLTPEGRAWLVHRFELRARGHLADRVSLVQALVLELRRRLAVSTPLLLYPCPVESPARAALDAAGFEPAQRSFIVRRATGLTARE